MLPDHSASCPEAAVQTSASTSTIKTSETRSSPRSRHKKCSKRKMELRNLRKIKNTKPDLSQTAAIATANASTPLLQLPPEIRNRIYRFVLGGNLLRIRRHEIKVKRDVVTSTKGCIKEQRFTHEICCWPASERMAYYFTVNECTGSYIMDARVHLWFCDSVVRGPKLNINLLHTCRLIYNEARFLPYSMNAFSFDTPRNLRAFTHFLIQRGMNLNHAIRSLHIELAYVGQNDREWKNAFKVVTRHMTLLESCRLTFDRLDQRTKWTRSASDAQGEGATKLVMDCFHAPRKWPTQSIMTFLSAWNYREAVKHELLVCRHHITG